MLDYIVTKPKQTPIPIFVYTNNEFTDWLGQQPAKLQTWVKAVGFNADADTWCLIPGEDGQVSQVLAGMAAHSDYWGLANLAANLPAGEYTFAHRLDVETLSQRAIAWGLSHYQFSRYKAPTKKIRAKLVLPTHVDKKAIANAVTAINWVRDLTNMPAEDMGPAELAQAAKELGQSFGAKVKQVIGENLLKRNYPLIYTVGRASNRPPRLIDLRWGKPKHPKITLVGKGVCFDTGGLDLKPAAGMLQMKKDMSGAAHILGLARMIMAANLPVCLRVLIPAVENSVNGNAYRPGDILRSRKGTTIEIGNTDAEGRLILADALTAACEDKPELLIDFATLTGAARIAMGADIGALFTPNNELAAAVVAAGTAEQDPVWQLPLYAPYRKLLDSRFADMNNVGSSPYGGAITAALFLQEFVDEGIEWAHFDVMAWNVSSRPGRPEGGEAMGIRAVFRWLSQEWLASKSL